MQVIVNDFFLGKQVQENGFLTIPLRDEFLENARLFIFETYCRIHQCIDIGMLSRKLNMKYDDAERWIVNLIRNARLDAKIDSKMGTVVMGTQHPNVYEQIIEKSKQLALRSYTLASNVAATAVAAEALTAR
jgi:translation initiation factor 3 subunit E